MLTVSQIILFICLFLILGLSVFTFIYGFKLKKIENSYRELWKYYIIFLYIMFTVSEILILIYYTKFFIGFGLEAFILSFTASVFIAVSLAYAWGSGNIKQILKSLTIK